MIFLMRLNGFKKKADSMDCFSARIGRWVGVLTLTAFVVAPTGCRSTRSTMSRVPGMGWMASDEDIQFDGADPMISGPTKPTAEATPELASRGGNASSRAPYQASEPAPRDRYATRPSGGTSGSASAYPDTGYPSPYEAAGAGPERGFYGSGDDSDSLASTEDEYQSPVDDYDDYDAPTNGDYDDYVGADVDGASGDYPAEDYPADRYTARDDYSAAADYDARDDYARDDYAPDDYARDY